MKRFLVFCIASVLSANAPLDLTADSTTTDMDSHIDSTATADLDSSNAIPPPPQKRIAPQQTI